MKNFRSFASYADFSAVTTNLTEEDLPFIAYREDIDKTFIYDKQPTLEIAYWKNSAATNETYTIPWTEWNDGVGYPVGIVVIPRDFLPDRKARIMALYDVNMSGTPFTDSASSIELDSSVTEPYSMKKYPSNVTNYIKIKNKYFIDFYQNASIFHFASSYGYNGTNNDGYIFGITKESNPRITQFNSDWTFNNDILTVNLSGQSLMSFISYYNGLSFFEEFLKGEARANVFLNGALAYKRNENDNFQWYLPTIIEFIIAMGFGSQINEILEKLGKICIEDKYFLSSVTLFGSNNVFTYASVDYISAITGRIKAKFRPFALLD